MPPTQFQRMEEYFDPRRSLQDRFAELADRHAIPDYTESRVNEAVIGYVAKFLCEYLQITATDIPDIQKAVQTKVKKLEMTDISRITHAAIRKKTEGISDAFGVQCAADIQTTAALVKEIAFNDSFERDDQFMGVDLGCGTGILGTAMAIAALRRDYRRPCIVLIDSQKNALKNAERVVRPLDTADFKPIEFDLRWPDVYSLFAPPVWVKYWVSETFSEGTAEIARLTSRGVHWKDAGISQAINGAVDPYMDVLENLLQYTPDFYNRVRQGKAALFPDPINGHYAPQSEHGRLRLQTGPQPGHVSLRDVCGEFRMFEDFGVTNRRWV